MLPMLQQELQGVPFTCAAVAALLVMRGVLAVAEQSRGPVGHQRHCNVPSKTRAVQRGFSLPSPGLSPGSSDARFSGINC